MTTKHATFKLIVLALMRGQLTHVEASKAMKALHRS